MVQFLQYWGERSFVENVENRNFFYCIFFFNFDAQILKIHFLYFPTAGAYISNLYPIFSNKKEIVSSTNKTDSHDITEILLKVGVKYHNPN
jgi:hypothetical protein